MVRPMRISTMFFALITSAAAMLLTGCSDDPVVDLDEFATGSSGSGSVTNDNSLGDSTPTGRITADGFYVLYDPAIPEVFNDKLAYSQQEVTITVFAEDVNELVELNGQTVNFKVEWGAFLAGRDSCDLVDGQCSVTWRSGDPATAPGSCFVAVTAWANGEETYFDANDNGLFDIAETHDDLEEPFLDIDSDGLFNGTISTIENVGELIDIDDFNGATTIDGDHDNGNGDYDGSQCASDNAANCSGRTSMIIHTRSNILIQQPFDVDENPATPDSVFCGTNLY